jgi:hypothetical protein
MPPLPNSRREKFAHELASGHSAAEAYELAGYKPNYGNCIRLKGNERIAARVLELQAKITGQIIDRAEVGRPGEFASMTEDELREHIVRSLHEVGISVQISSSC